MKDINNILITIMVMIFTSLNIIAQTPEERFANAVEEYNSENFANATNLFQELYDEGYRNFELLYDLGNSYFRINDMPSAILYYEKALRLSPTNDDVKHNLILANKLIIDKIEAVPVMFYVKWWNSFTNIFSLKNWAIISLILFGVTIWLLVLMILVNNITFKKSSLRAAIFVFILFMISICANISLRSNATDDSYAIVFTPTVTAKGSPIDNGVDIFVVHKGTKVHINDHVGEWIEIVLANGTTGWIRIDDVRII